MPRILSFLIAIAICTGTALAQGPLSVGEAGELIRDGKPYRAYGVNFYSAFMRYLRDPANTSFRKGFKELGELKIPFARFAACGYMPSDMKLYFENKEEYFARMDAVVKCAEENGVGLVPSFFWYNACLPDLAGEPRKQWGNPDSKTTALMRQTICPGRAATCFNSGTRSPR